MEREYRYVSGQTRAANRAFLGNARNLPPRMLQEGVYSAAFQTCLAGYKESRDMLRRILGHAGMCTASAANHGRKHAPESQDYIIKGNAHLGTITLPEHSYLEHHHG